MSGQDEVEPAVHTQGLSKRFGRTWAVRGVSFTLPDGSVLILVGPNGAGKSTLLELLATLLRPTAGSARIFGRDVTKEGEAVRRSLGVLTHEPMLYPQLTVGENLTFFAMLHGLSKAEAGSRVARLSGEWDLASVAEDPVRSLSHGTAKRAALARAVLHEPALLLLDEPFSGLDEGSRELLRTALHRLHGGGTTVVLTAHDAAPAAELADTVAVLQAGQLRGCEARDRWSADEVQDFYHRCTASQEEKEQL